jgi:uncharacterized repeat protein (TIGR03843 family)
VTGGLGAGVDQGGTGRPDPVADLDEPTVLELLREGELEVSGRLVDASNATLYCTVTLDGRSAPCVHKPVAGERPLWDFPDGTLANREVATYLVSAATGWALVPPTVMRGGPFGPGMCQLWVETEEEALGELVALRPAGRRTRGWLPVIEAVLGDGERAVLAHRDDDRLRRLAVFDVVVNNADRKGGHLLPTAAGHLYGVDHGVCFSADDKLRTLLWGWAGEPLPAEATEVLGRLAADLAGGLGATLGELLDPDEVSATRDRIDRLLAEGRHPSPGGGWPAVPWPPI